MTRAERREKKKKVDEEDSKTEVSEDALDVGELPIELTREDLINKLKSLMVENDDEDDDDFDLSDFDNDEDEDADDDEDD